MTLNLDAKVSLVALSDGATSGAERKVSQYKQIDDQNQRAFNILFETLGSEKSMDIKKHEMLWPNMI
jgi:hypothetical protein